MNFQITKMRMLRIYLLSIILVLTPLVLTCQSVDSASFTINARQSFYSFESTGEFMIHTPARLSNYHFIVTLKIGDEIVTFSNLKPVRGIMRLPFVLKLRPSLYNVEARINSISGSGVIYQARTELVVLSYKTNEVKTDRLTGGLIVNRRQLFPFGFYCYSPVFPTLPEEEVVKGFNLISPYQKIMPETMNERKAYMDRCATLGMKVNYNLLSVSGGGGVGSKIEDLSDAEKNERMITEIKTFMDHPALLGWYVSDEPNGNNITPEQLEMIYRTVKEIDPWHPVSIVFMTPFLAAKKYSEALDIVMADPYPIPDFPVTMAGDAAAQLKAEFKGKKPFWIVPQAFGGGELWGREPTVQEIRSMTWQSIINGATGIQYFVRQGLNYFPKSTATWSECGRMAIEVAELTPWLLSDEETLAVDSYSKNVLVSSRIHEGRLIIMAVNKINEPVNASFRITGYFNGKAKVLFENRTVQVTGGVVSDNISPFGSQVYLIDLKSEKHGGNQSINNLIKDPGFEDLSSPGIPSACYARPGGDRGATYFLDSREFFEGNHSLRIITPEENKSLAIRFFPFQVKAGSSYTISIWAKSDPEQRFYNVTQKEDLNLHDRKETPQYAEIAFGEFGLARFVPDKEWRQYITFVTIASDTLARFKTNLILKMPGQGVAWFDEVKVIEDK